MFNEAVITIDGLELDAKIRAGHTIATFTYVKLGNGIYDGTEDLSIVTTMKSIKQSFGISSILVTDNKTVRLRTVSDNSGIDEGYLISEIGIFAQDPDKGEILYSIALGVENKMDYQPSETELPGATSTFDTYVSVSNVEAATIITGCGAAASAEDLNEIKCPEFDDSGEVEEITSFPVFLEKIKSKMNFFEFFRNLKTGLKFVLHAGQIVNNCVSDNAELPLSAAQGKILMELINQTNGNLNNNNLRIILANNEAETSHSVLNKNSADGIYLGYHKSSGRYRINARQNGTWLKEEQLVTGVDLQVKHYVIPKPAANNVFTRIDVWYCGALKYGNVVTLRINMSGSMNAINEPEMLFILPQEYRPKFEPNINYISQNNNAMLIVVRTNGDVEISNLNTAVSGWICRQCITYVTDN